MKSDIDLRAISFLVPIIHNYDENGELIIDLTEANKFNFNVHQELYLLATRSKGGFTWDICYKLPVYLRKFYLKLLSEDIKKENEEIEKATGNKRASKPNIQRPHIPSISGLGNLSKYKK